MTGGEKWTRVPTHLLADLVEHDGTLDGLHQLSETGVLRLALDLQAARNALASAPRLAEENARLRAALQQPADAEAVQP